MKSTILTKTVMLVMLAACLSLLTSCGGGKKQKQEEGLKPMTTAVSGDLSDCFEVVDRTYKPVKETINSMVAVELLRTEAPLPFSLDGTEVVSFGTTMFVPYYIQVGFGIEFRDADGNVLDKQPANSRYIYSDEDVIEVLKLKPGETGSIRFSLDNKASEAKAFKISSAVKINGDRNDVASSAPVAESGSDIPSSVVVTGTNVRLRTGPSLQDAPITDASGKNIHPEKGETLRCVGDAGDFYKVLFNGREVFISKQFAVPSSASSALSGDSDYTIKDAAEDLKAVSSAVSDAASALGSLASLADDADSGKSLSSEEIDQLLKDYGKVVDDYISLMKRMYNADATDMQLASEFATLTTRLTSVEMKLAGASSKMSDRQDAKEEAISAKLLAAAEKYEKKLKQKYPNLFGD